MEVLIRPYRAADRAKVRALHDRMGPYRPEDEAAVPAMVARAAEAERAGDRWVPLVAAPDSLDAIETSYLAFWVAVIDAGAIEEEVVGMVGVRRCGAESPGIDGLPATREWARRGDVAELCRLRVAPEVWRRGLGARLSRTAIDWAREHDYRSMVLNTTTPQAPAQALYRRFGFREVGRSFTGQYELVWFELPLGRLPP
jgi:ribosomal protein S18 acetylase RimI-like enzyme